VASIRWIAKQSAGSGNESGSHKPPRARNSSSTANGSPTRRRSAAARMTPTLPVIVNPSRRTRRRPAMSSTIRSAETRGQVSHCTLPFPAPFFGTSSTVSKQAMARPLRLEFAGALYHVTARGNERRNIFLGNGYEDRGKFLELLSQVCERFGWICHAYCLMSNHYHLLVETPHAKLCLPSPSPLEQGRDTRKPGQLNRSMQNPAWARTDRQAIDAA
jgi:hypothetical protein